MKITAVIIMVSSCCTTSSWAAEDELALRQRCYAMGVMHGDDETSPTIIGIPDGACRESYDAGRAYFLKQQQKSDKTTPEVDKMMRDTCREAKAKIDRIENDKNYTKGDVAHFRALMSTTECEKFEK